MKATFIRHGQSTGDVGFPCENLFLMKLTEKGWQQAREVAANWTETPDLIVTSSYLHAQQTAQPTIERFSGVPVEVWPIQEFTYLEPSRWNGTLSVQRKPHIEAYWKAANPEFCDGPGAESFGALLRRAEDTLKRLLQLPEDRRVLIFSHDQFIQAVRMIILHPSATDRKRMEHFWGEDGLPAVQNAGLVSLIWEADTWRHKMPDGFGRMEGRH